MVGRVTGTKHISLFGLRLQLPTILTPGKCYLILKTNVRKWQNISSLLIRNVRCSTRNLFDIHVFSDQQAIKYHKLFNKWKVCCSLVCSVFFGRWVSRVAYLSNSVAVLPICVLSFIFYMSKLEILSPCLEKNLSVTRLIHNFY